MDDPVRSFSLFLQLTDDSASISWVGIFGKFFLLLIFVAINAFFVASEFALVSVRRARIEKRAEDGSPGAAAVIRLLDNPTRFISAVQLGVTLASLALGWLGEPTVELLFEPLVVRIAGTGPAAYIAHIIAIVVSICIITFFVVVLGELVPKMFALDRTEMFATFAARPLELFAKVFSPVLWAFNFAGGSIGKLLGLQASLRHSAVYSEDELRHLIRMSQEGGQINEGEENLINKVFEFSETTVKEAMVPRTGIVAISANSSLEEIATAFHENGYSRLPVFRDSLDDIAGVLHSKDLVRYTHHPRKFKLEEVIHKPNYVVDTAKLEDVLRQMQTEKFHFGFVVDEHGGVEGIITLEDLLEEIVGDISDEHDEEVNEQIDEQADGSYLLDGGLAVRDLNRRLEMSVPVSEVYTTIAGFLMSEAGRLLDEGETVPFNGHIFRIEKVYKRRILQVRMEKVVDPTVESPV